MDCVSTVNFWPPHPNPLSLKMGRDGTAGLARAGCRGDVDGALVNGQGGFAQRFGQRGVGVAEVRQILGAGAEFHRGGDLGDQIAGSRSQDVHAQHPVGPGIGQDLDPPVGVAQRLGATAGLKREEPLRYSRFSCCSCSSVLPTLASSGCV
jgi:hypothetical protein